MKKTYATPSVVSNGTIVRNTMLGTVKNPEPAGDFLDIPQPAVAGFYL